MSAMSEFEGSKEKRKRFLRAVYDLTNGVPERPVSKNDIASSLNMDLSNREVDEEFAGIAQYLHSKRRIIARGQRYTIIMLTPEGIDDVENDKLQEETSASAPVTPDEFSDAAAVGEPPVEIQESLQRFKQDHPDPTRVAFIMMQFGQTRAHNEIAEAVREGLAARGIAGVRADDKRYHDDLFPNVLTYMHGCGMAVAIFERIEAERLNPNVALEVGYSFAMWKPVCLLKDKTLTALHADLVGKLYDPFDPQDPAGTIPPAVQKWLSDKDLPKS